MRDYRDVKENKCEKSTLWLYVRNNMALRFGRVASTSIEDKQ